MNKFMSALLAGAAAVSLTACSTNTASSGNTSSAETIADQVIVGKIYTGDTEDTVVSALAVKDGVILYAGSEEDVQTYIGDTTEVTELNENELVVPGFVDGHTHATRLISAYETLCSIPEGATAQECVDTIAAFIEEHPGWAYYKARGWINSAFENGCPTADLLDAIDTDAPIYALSSDGHSYWTNTAMMEYAGVTAETEDPEGGTIERYEDGTPNGCFRDTAEALISAAIPVETAEAKIDGILETQAEYAAMGYTSYLEAIANEQYSPLDCPASEAYEQLDRDGELLLYTQGAFVVNNDETAMEVLDKAIEMKEETAGGKYEVTNIKIFMDGVIEGGTAYLSEAYETDEEYYGEARWGSEESLELLTQIIVKANENGMTVHFHAIGDQAITDAVSCVEKAYEQAGDAVKEARNAITHLQILNEDDFARMAELNMVAVINPWCNKYPGFYTETEVMYLGEDRASKEYPVRKFMDAGVHCSFGTDYGASFVVEPMDCIHTIVTRMTADEDPETLLGEEECLSVEETLKMFSSGGAYELCSENDFGVLSEGMEADLLVLSKDILSEASIEIENTEVLKTMSDGVWVYTK